MYAFAVLNISLLPPPSLLSLPTSRLVPPPPIVRSRVCVSRDAGRGLTLQFLSPSPPHCSENEANAAYHRSTTAAEILSDFAGRRLDYFVGGWGTGGTIVGVGEMLRLAVREAQAQGRGGGGGR